MDGNEAALQTAINAIQALGRGFDVNFDTRLLYCKGIAGSRILQIDEEPTWDMRFSNNVIVSNVPRGVKNEPCIPGRESSGVCSYDEMVKHFNTKADLLANIPLGSFNAAFNFTGSKHIDAASTKSLSVDGFVIPLAKIQLNKSSWVLHDNVMRAIPTSWDPPSLASFIENFGTHVITSVTIGGKDVIYVKQHQSSPLSAMEMKNYVQDIGNRRLVIQACSTAKEYTLNQQDITIIFRRRGGDDLEQSHKQWAKTVQSSPDIIEMAFVPISDLIKDSAKKEHLTRAISLYLEYKPPIEELRYFLEFQIPRVWAPLHDRLPGQQRKEPVCPSLQFSLMGQKLYVSQEQVSVGRKPVTGVRLFLDGTKQNRLSIHLQHLASLPKIMFPHWDTHVAIGAPKWLGPEEQDSRWFEPVKWKNFSHVSTAPIESPETFAGAQLGVWDFGSRNVLYMKLLYSRLPGCTIRRSWWDHSPSDKPRKPGAAEVASGDSSSGSSENVSGNKLVKFIDMSEMTKGPEDLPGHWLVTGGKLGIEKGKIVLRVKYSLLNY
ncbi:MACPF domain-containing protein CAD1 [Bienertia sinuspersici]